MVFVPASRWAVDLLLCVSPTGKLHREARLTIIGAPYGKAGRWKAGGGGAELHCEGPGFARAQCERDAARACPDQKKRRFRGDDQACDRAGRLLAVVAKVKGLLFELADFHASE